MKMDLQLFMFSFCSRIKTQSETATEDFFMHIYVQCYYCFFVSKQI